MIFVFMAIIPPVAVGVPPHAPPHDLADPTFRESRRVSCSCAWGSAWRRRSYPIARRAGRLRARLRASG
jgi:hypothetical protein